MFQRNVNVRRKHFRDIESSIFGGNKDGWKIVPLESLGQVDRAFFGARVRYLDRGFLKRPSLVLGSQGWDE